MSKATTAKNRRRTAMGALPRWNLKDLYAGPDAPALKADLKWAEKQAGKFRKAYEGRLARLDGKGLGEAIARYERLVERWQRIISYAYLRYVTDLGNPKSGAYFQTMQERVTKISTETVFFNLELNLIDDKRLKRQLKHPKTAHYAPWIRDNRVYRPHQLSDEMEKLLHQKYFTVPGRKGGKTMTLSATLNLLSDKDGKVRQRAAHALSKRFGEKMRVLTLITNTLAKDKEIEDQWRKYPHPISQRNLSNLIENEVVEALVEAVKSRYGRLSHRYYRLKAKWFGVKKLNTWDRNAPLPDDSDRLYTWREARELVLRAYGGFAPEMSEIAGRFFAKGWIDAPPLAGKATGAFCHSTVPSVHPYVLLNFHGRARDVMTLAHELGHGVHQVLAAPQGAFMSDTPLTLAETASVFGEMLTFQAMLAAENNPKRRRIMLAGKVEDMMNTVIRQIAFHQFETQVHAERPKGELSAERLGKIWMSAQKESLGPAFRFDDEYRHFWSYIPHFVHSPFYVYAYAFGDCLVNSLYDVFCKGHPRFQAKYFEMLKAGGTLRHKELLKPFGLNASDPKFWARGLDVISGFIDELEASR
jgi:oligoendopeptidase F